MDFNSFSWHTLFLLGGGNVLGKAISSSQLLDFLAHGIVEILPKVGGRRGLEGREGGTSILHASHSAGRPLSTLNGLQEDRALIFPTRTMGGTSYLS